MANLFWKHKGTIKALLATHFKTEEEFERMVFDTPQILEDIYLIKRQIRGGSKSGVPDIIGINSDGDICIIEMKNATVDSSIIPQVLQYAFWAEKNPDSIKSLWLESKNKPEDLVIDWDDFEIRILVVAPAIMRSTLDIVEKINYPVDLIEVKRWIEGNHMMILVNKLEQDSKTSKTKPVTGLETYDAEFYKKHYNSQSARHFMDYARQVEALVRKKNWPLEIKFNKHYCGFKAGFFNAFGIKWVGSKTFAFFFKLAEKDACRIKRDISKYYKLWKEAVYYIEPGKTKVCDFMSLFDASLRQLAGHK